MAVPAQAVIDGYARLCADLQARVIYLEAELAVLSTKVQGDIPAQQHEGTAS